MGELELRDVADILDRMAILLQDSAEICREIGDITSSIGHPIEEVFVKGAKSMLEREYDALRDTQSKILESFDLILAALEPRYRELGSGELAVLIYKPDGCKVMSRRMSVQAPDYAIFHATIFGASRLVLIAREVAREVEEVKKDLEFLKYDFFVRKFDDRLLIFAKRRELPELVIATPDFAEEEIEVRFPEGFIIAPRESKAKIERALRGLEFETRIYGNWAVAFFSGGVE